MPASYPNNNVLLAGTLNTTANTANQTILTYTVTAGKVLWLEYVEANVKLTTFATTATDFGTLSLLVDNVAKQTFTVVCGPGVLNTPLYIDIQDPLPFQPGTVIKVVCTPSAATAFTWEANIAGYEK